MDFLDADIILGIMMDGILRSRSIKMNNMKISVKKIGGEWTLELTQGVQTFNFVGVSKTKKYHLWLTRMFRKALKAHNKELLKKYVQ